VTRFARFAAVFAIAAVLGSIPVLMLARAMLTGPKAVTSEFPVILMMPALGWLVPFAISLAFIWWRGGDLTPLSGAMLGFLSVCAYGAAIAGYLVAARQFEVSFVILRIVFALPSAVAVAVLTAASAWLVPKVFGEPRRHDERR
jgi:hypothetical protein